MKVPTVLAVAALAACCAVAQAQLPPREALGASDKYRVLVDKVVSKANGWVFTGEHMRAIRAAGFNVVCPRKGGYDLTRSRKQALMAQDEGLYFTAWMRGSLEAEGDVKMVWQDGKEQNLCSPNSDELWDATTRLIVGHAQISAAVPAFIGTFMDFENYAPESLGRATVDRKTDKPQLGLYGMKSRMVEAQSAEGAFEVHNVAGMSMGYLQQLQVVVLQNFNMPIAANSEISRNLHAYVEQGGGLLLGHDTAWFMESIFPEVAVRATPANKVERGRYVVETNLVVAEPHPCLGAAPRGREFPTEFRDHMIFKAGPAGRIVIRNTFGDPVVVVADVGRGRVVFSGCYYGYSKPLSGLEQSVFQSMLNWLGRLDEAPPQPATPDGGGQEP